MAILPTQRDSCNCAVWSMMFCFYFGFGKIPFSDVPHKYAHESLDSYRKWLLVMIVTDGGIIVPKSLTCTAETRRLVGFEGGGEPQPLSKWSTWKPEMMPDVDNCRALHRLFGIPSEPAAQPQRLSEKEFVTELRTLTWRKLDAAYAAIPVDLHQ
eukprot:1540242-Rhodomonas_salina.1